MAHAGGGARRLYASFGFETYGREQHATKLPDGSYVDEELMVLFLGEASPAGHHPPT